MTFQRTLSFCRGTTLLLVGLLVPGLLAVGLGGCYSFSGTTLPGHLRTVRIPPVQNRTLESSLADRITDGLIEGFRVRSNLRKVNENADCELLAVLNEYSHRPLNVSGDQVQNYRIDISMSVRFVDRAKGDTLYKEDRLPGFGTYNLAAGQTEAEGQRTAIDNIVKTVLDNTVSGW